MMEKRSRLSTAAVNSPELYLSPEDWARLQAVNIRWNDDIVAHRAVVLDIYGPLVRAADNSATTVSRDLPYGEDSRHRLDIFTPAGAESRPVLVFMHGGAFTRGSKSVDGAIYDNVPLWFARQGFVGVNIEYRLAPAARFPAGAQDLALAIQWIADNIGDHGGDPRKIILMGHSAGGCHVASYLLDPETGVAPHDSIVAAIVVSGRLRLDVRPGNPNANNVAAYCGDDPAVLERCSPVNHVANARWPMLIAIAEYENRYLDAYGLEFASRLGDAQGRAPWFVQLRGHNHTSAVAHFNTDEDWFGRHILAFLKS
ncbi:MAG: alpha/beta hydrolase [Pseudolabrys sp.]|nr:alpha/beta hydrolase [Pseudolabrys sp.]